MIQLVKKNAKKSILPGLVIAIFLTVGFFMKRNGALRISPFLLGVWVVTFLASYAGTVLFYSFVDWINGRDIKRIKEFLPNRLISKSWVYGNICFMILFIMWIPSFLALYPGLFVYDAPWQYYMYFIDGVTAHQPVLHTYMLGGILEAILSLTGSINKAVAAYTLIQMVIMAFGEAYILYIFHREKVNTAFHIIALLFFGLFPVSCIFVMTITKDTLFAVACADFFVLTVLLYKDVKKFFEHKNDVFVWAVSLFSVLVFRNNAKYALIIALPFFVFELIKVIKKNKKEDIKKLYIKSFAMLLATIAIYTIYDIPITKAITIDGISTAEMLSVPCQQLARVYNYRYDELSDEQRERIEKLFGNDEKLKEYVPQIADNIKGIVDIDLIKEDKIQCFMFWLNTGLQFPGEYINSFLENTYAFWYPWPEYVIYGNGGKAYTPTYSILPAEQNPKIGFLFDFYRKFSEGKIADGESYISCIYSPALYFYVYILISVYCISKKKRHTYISLLMICLIWMTFLLGPVAQIRYSLYLLWLFPCYPLLLKEEKKE